MAKMDEHFHGQKPQKSELLLENLGTEILILTGIAANNCVLFTANDVYMRAFRLVVPGDCVASNSEEERAAALKQMRNILKADIGPSPDLELLGWAVMKKA
jgi:nicotinamidase-related amidase